MSNINKLPTKLDSFFIYSQKYTTTKNRNSIVKLDKDGTLKNIVPPAAPRPVQTKGFAVGVRCNTLLFF